ncbi:ferredoxin [Dactylosporangium sp. CA-092794]|uniref:ferredoxin n=1 Tax=Dactylosporangium sp. CA-092794 TaxID=3239929 RepID=UPI003D8A2DF5
MRVTVDSSKCVAAGLCVMTEASVFDQAEDTGIVTLLTDRPAPEIGDQVREAARICPAVAIAIHEDGDA